MLITIRRWHKRAVDVMGHTGLMMAGMGPSLVMVSILMAARGVAAGSAADVTKGKQTSADVRLAGIFTNGMVLEQGMNDPIWGTATAGERVKISFCGQQVTAKANATGAWRTHLAPLKAGGPWPLTVAGKSRITLSTVYVGDVWVCSGQSNMEYVVGRSIWRGIKNNVTPALRLYKNGKWQEAAGAAISNFSAVGYYFGKRLYDDLAARHRMIPLGIIDNSLGATNISNWMTGGFCYTQRVEPIEHFAIKGVVWYQGEFNPGDTHYAQELQEMIGTWRKAWGQGSFPFLVVQLHRYGAKPEALSPPDPRAGWAVTRNQQAKATLETPNTGLVVTYDLTDGNLHCNNKGPIGERVMRLAEGMCYGMGPSCAVRSAIADGASFESKKDLIQVKFKYADHGVRSGPGPHSEITDIFLFTPHGRVIAAKAVPCGPDSIAIDTHGVEGCPDVYYAWRNYPLGNLMNGMSFLWVSPFRLESLRLTPVTCRGRLITLLSNKPLDAAAGKRTSYAIVGARVTQVSVGAGQMEVRLTTDRVWKRGEQVRIGFPHWRCWDHKTPLPPLVFRVLPGRYVTLDALEQCRVGQVQSIGLPGVKPRELTGVRTTSLSGRQARPNYDTAWATSRLLRPEEADMLRGRGPARKLLTGRAGQGWQVEHCGRGQRFNLLRLVKAPGVGVWSALVRYDVYAQRKMVVQLCIADEGVGRAYVNGDQVGQWRAYKSARIPVARLHRGWNTVVLELSSDGNNRRAGHNFFGLRILNSQGNYARGVSYGVEGGS